MMAGDPSESLVGQQVGPYQVVALLGAGGMGEVYRALDTRLNRPVAIKFLSAELADPSARRRFQQEAKMASALNHPHILTVHEVGEVGGRQYLVTEYVDGGTLRDWARETRTWRQIVELLVGVADGLAAAHQAGILHRDIKPENILVAKSGYAKVADFGLAKLDEHASSEAVTRAVTTQTRPGVIIGTVAYMSPEQASGKPLDARSDIFSFGVVLYELLAGRRPFAGATDLELLQTILHRVPEPLPAELPVGLRLVVDKALEKDPGDRYQALRELVVDLRRAARQKTEEAGPTALSAAPTRRFGWAVLTLVLGTALAAGLAGWFVSGRMAERPAAQNVQVQRLTDAVGLEESPAISPDGKTVAFVAVSGGRRQIWVRLLAGGTPLALTNDDVDHYAPRWSPDSVSVIYYTPGAEPGEAGTIWEVPSLGGATRRLVASLVPGDLSHDGKSLAFVRFREGATELAVAARDLSSTRTVTKLTGSAPAASLRWSPDDHRLAFHQRATTFSFSDDLVIADVGGGEPRRISGGSMFGGFAWMLDGSGLIVSSGRGSTMVYPPTFNLWALPLDGGAMSQLTFGESSYVSPDIDPHGNLVASRMRAQSDVWKFPVTGGAADNARRGVRITTHTGQVQTLTVSADDTEVAFLSDNGGHANVWTAQIASGEMRQLTRESNPAVVVSVPFWSPRGDLINFLSNRNSGASGVTLWVMKPDGSEPRDLGIGGAWVCWSSDGRWIYFSDLAKGVYHIKKVAVSGGQAVTVRDDNAVGCASAPGGSALYYLKPLALATGARDFEIRVAAPENGPSRLLGRFSGSRVPYSWTYAQPYLSPDGEWLALPLIDGSTMNLWALSTAGNGWRQLTDFTPRNVEIVRRIGWSKDGTHIYASVSDVDADIVMLAGLKW